MAKRVAVLLSGCGVYDGSEIQEAVFILLALSQAGAQVQCTAPDKDQMHVINHRAGQPEDGAQRNVLTESARIARGNIVPLSQIKAADYDAILLPGGFGAAKNLCDYAVAGAGSTVDADVARVLQEFHAAGKAIGAMCIAPVVVAGALAQVQPKVTLTIGNDVGTAADIVALGGVHQDCVVTDCVVDAANKVVTSPAYMYGDASLADIFAGVSKAVQATLAL